jgi:hypothetical protein
MAIVHCRYGHDHGDDGIDMGDWVWLCVVAIGPVDAPGEDLEPYHNWRPLHPCSCGYDPRPPAPDRQWRPGHP